MFDRISQGRGVVGFLKMFQMLLFVFSLALGVEYLFRKLVLSRFKSDPQASEGSDLLRLWTIVSQAIPEFMALGLFVGAAYTFYVLIWNRKHIRQWIRGDAPTVHVFRAHLADKWLPITFCDIISLWLLWGRSFVLPLLSVF